MKEQIKSKIATAVMFSLLTSCLAGCGKQSLDTQTVIDSADDIETVEVNQNDYRGGTKRIEAIRGNILNIVDGFNQTNFAIQAEHPCSYWSSEDYQYFIAHFISDEIYYHTSLFNEFETDWETVETTLRDMYANADGNTPQDFAVTRVTDNHYTLGYREQGAMTEWLYHPIDIQWKWNCVYNPTHDWLQTIRYGTPNSGKEKTNFETQILEYGRRGNVFIIQTEYERLYVVYESTEPVTVENTSMYILDNKGEEIPVTQEDIDSGAVNIENVQYHTNSIVTYNPLKNNTIKAFYYSRLDGNVLPQYYNEEESGLEEEDGLGTSGSRNENINYDLVLTPYAMTEEFANAHNIPLATDFNDGYIKTHYNTCDSIFTHINDIDKDWVTEMGTYQQVISYENGDLTVRTANQLSRLYEVFKFYSNGDVENHTEPMVVPEPTSISVEEGDGSISDNDNDSVSENDVPHYALYDLEKNCDGLGGLGAIAIGTLNTELPIKVSDLNELGYNVDIEALGYADNEDYASVYFRANARDANNNETGDYISIGSLDTANMELVYVTQEGVANGLEISVCGVNIGMPLDDVRESFGQGTTLNDGIGFYDGDSYLYVQTDLMKDENDNNYYGVSSIYYATKTYATSDEYLTTPDLTEESEGENN